MSIGRVKIKIIDKDHAQRVGEIIMGQLILKEAKKRRKFVKWTGPPKVYNYQKGWFFSPNEDLRPIINLRLSKHRKIKDLFVKTSSGRKRTPLMSPDLLKEGLVEWNTDVFRIRKGGPIRPVKGKDGITRKGWPYYGTSRVPLCHVLVCDSLDQVGVTRSLLMTRDKKYHSPSHLPFERKLFKRIVPPKDEVIPGDIAVFNVGKNSRIHHLRHVAVISEVMGKIDTIRTMKRRRGQEVKKIAYEILGKKKWKTTSSKEKQELLRKEKQLPINRRSKPSQIRQKVIIKLGEDEWNNIKDEELKRKVMEEATKQDVKRRQRKEFKRKSRSQFKIVDQHRVDTHPDGYPYEQPPYHWDKKDKFLRPKLSAYSFAPSGFKVPTGGTYSLSQQVKFEEFIEEILDKGWIEFRKYLLKEHRLHFDNAFYPETQKALMKARPPP